MIIHEKSVIFGMLCDGSFASSLLLHRPRRPTRTHHHHRLTWQLCLPRERVGVHHHGILTGGALLRHGAGGRRAPDSLAGNG